MSNIVDQYFLANCSFAIILKKMAHNSKLSKLSEKGDECTFTWKVFATWDYGIANVETAHNKVECSYNVKCAKFQRFKFFP
jgi:hypothetical protein